MAGVELLQQQSRLTPFPEARRKTSPIVSGLLSVLLPGLGAAYNGQTTKAVFHFALFASFFQLSAMSNGAPFFVWGIVCTWLFATVDAYRTAQLIRAGLSPKEEEDAIARRLYGNPLAWGVVLVILGLMLLLHTFFNIRLPIREILPLALIALGVYMAFDYLRRRRMKNISAEAFEQLRPPPSVI
ncbi:MAG: hypothetical protein ICV68_06130 [Pyrinomonadaceae bacterium]|nr:hypothetical protein [Pyrinomonadaceae bacterium]